MEDPIEERDSAEVENEGVSRGAIKGPGPEPTLGGDSGEEDGILADAPLPNSPPAFGAAS